MTRITPRVSPLHTISIAYQSPQETLQGTPTTLPTSEPTAGNEQVKYTIASGDLPTFSGCLPVLPVYCAIVYAAGKAITAATISWRMKRNGTSVATGTQAVGANTFYTVSAFFEGPSGVGLVAGDILTVSLWSNQTDSNWDYNAYMAHCTRLQPSQNRFKQTLCNVTYIIATTPTVLVSGVPSAVTTSGMLVMHTSYGYNSLSAGTYVYPTITMYTGAYLFRLYNEDYLTYANTAIVNTHATYRPYYTRDALPTSISFRYLYAVTV